MDFERTWHEQPDPQGTPSRLILGPGRPHELQALLRGQDPTREVLCITDLSELLHHQSAPAILDGNLVPAEDLGILRRALQASDSNLTLMGGDPSTGPLRQLLKHPRTTWIPYPPDSEELARLAVRPAPESSPQPQPTKRIQPPTDPPAPMVDVPSEPIVEITPTAVAPPQDPDLAQIEAILAQPVASLQVTELSSPSQESAVAAPPVAVRPAATRRSAPPRPEPEPKPTPAPVSPPAPMTTEPPWFKDQVADLADLVQTIYASTTALQADGESPGPTGLHTDALRLVQFTRTLGYLASPPPRGEAEIDLSKLSEELLRSAGAAADAPRFMMRTDEPLSVRANKELLVQALDAIIVLARLCAGPEGEVRLTGKRTNAQTVSLTLAFPSGPLDGLRPDQIIVPYALRATLPDMGKNALRAAARIVEGQGGTLELSEAGTSRLCFTLTLPAV